MLLLLSLINLELRLFLSIPIPQINLIILTFNTPSQPLLLSPLILLIPLKHRTSQLLLCLLSFIKNLMHIALEVILPINQILKVNDICFCSQCQFETLFIDLFLDFLSNQLFHSRIRAA